MAGLEDLSLEQLRELAARAQSYEPSFNLVQQIAKDPEARNMFQRYLKKKNPNLSIPEIDGEDRMRAALEAETKAREALELKIQQDEIRQRLEAERKRVMEQYKLTEEDMKGVEKIMMKTDDNPEPVPYYDKAVKLYLHAREPSVPSPASYSPPLYSMPEKEVWGKGIGNPAELNRIALREAYRARAEIAGGKVAQ
jgi:hypothetical protein